MSGEIKRLTQRVEELKEEVKYLRSLADILGIPNVHKQKRIEYVSNRKDI
jgi:hypothetical protein